mmetsp:Transcript_39287/g.122997  ORF Transcript_39287/g.122997 Transcript_39287/m.122997 type:complete len:385 (+) Transcript_39287:269-1423(+)
MEGPAGGWAAWWRGMNTNVRWALLQAAGAGVADSVWTTTVVSSFLYVLADKSNTAVGAIEAVQGMTTLLIALPMGMVADRWSKAGVIRIGGVFAILATLCMSTVVVLASDKEEEGANSASVKRLLFAFGGCACLWGVTDAVTQGPVPALFADSLPTGNRSRWYTYGFIANMAARTVGPAVSIAMFCICGDEWTLPEIRTVFLAGMAAELLLSAPTFFFFDDSKALGSEAAPLTESLLADLEGAEGDDEAPHDDGRVIFGRYCVGRFLNIKPRHIPYIMFCKDVLVAFGSGMTVKVRAHKKRPKERSPNSPSHPLPLPIPSSSHSSGRRRWASRRQKFRASICWFPSPSRRSRAWASSPRSASAASLRCSPCAPRGCRASCSWSS